MENHHNNIKTNQVEMELRRFLGEPPRARELIRGGILYFRPLRVSHPPALMDPIPEEVVAVVQDDDAAQQRPPLSPPLQRIVNVEQEEAAPLPVPQALVEPAPQPKKLFVRLLITFPMISIITKDNGIVQRQLRSYGRHGGRVFISFNDFFYASAGHFVRPLTFLGFRSTIELRESILHFLDVCLNPFTDSFSIQMVLFRTFVENVVLPLRAQGVFFFFDVAGTFEVKRRNRVHPDNPEYGLNQIFINEEGEVEQEIIFTMKSNFKGQLCNFLVYLATKVSQYKRDSGLNQDVFTFYTRYRDTPEVDKETLQLDLVHQVQDIY